MDGPADATKVPIDLRGGSFGNRPFTLFGLPSRVRMRLRRSCSTQLSSVHKFALSWGSTASTSLRTASATRRAFPTVRQRTAMSPVVGLAKLRQHAEGAQQGHEE